MLGIYFSATGNSRYASEVFLNELDTCATVISIGDKNAAQMLKETDNKKSPKAANLNCFRALSFSYQSTLGILAILFAISSSVGI